MLRRAAASIGAGVCACLMGCGGSTPAPHAASSRIATTRTATTATPAATTGADSVATVTTATGSVVTVTTATHSATTATTADSTATGTADSAATITTSADSTATTTPPPPRPRAPNPGSLPQTDQVPSAGTAAFHAEMRALWTAVQTNSVKAGLPAFFPELAYEQLKAIGDPGSDWEYRLVADYGLDIGAAHALLGAHAADAKLLAVQVPASYAHWIDPGVCYNSVGYYELPNARVVYSEDGTERSFGIASMISWRGVWYVVHLGAILRDAAAGVVDDPSEGAGTAVPSTTC